MKPSLSATGLLAWTASNIYSTTNGSTFTLTNSPSLSSSNFISDVQEVPSSSASSGYELVVGTGTNNVSYTASGYFEGAESALGSVSTWVGGDSGVIAPNSISSTYDALFASKPVTKLYFDNVSSQKMLFAGISASGLGTTAYGLVSAPYPWTGTWTAQ